MNKVLQRVILGAVLFVSVFIMPWWFTILLSGVLIFYFDFYWEALVAAFLMESLYALPGVFEQGWNFIFPLLVSVIFLASFPLKDRIKFYNN